jgi:glycosyltransferase involved in cell wall biosynthesis
VKRGLRAPTLFWLDTWLIRRRLRAIRPHLIHAWGSEQGAALIASRLPYPALVTVQGLMNWIAERVPVNPYERLGAFVERRALRRARFATTESRFAVEYLQHHYPQLRVLQIEHAPNRIFESVIRKPDTATVRFLFVGAFSQLKGLDLLATALDRLRQSFDFQVTLVGGPRSGFLDHVRQQTSPALWNQVEIKENLSSEEVAAEMARATALLFPTRVDTSPNAVKEAVVAGLPVAASAIGGIVDYVIPGRNGITFEAGSAEGLRVAIQKVLEHSTFRSGRVDPSTLAEMRAYLSPTRMAASFLEAYRQVAG